MVVYSRTPQVVYSDTPVGRIGERSNPAGRFPAHSRPAMQAPDTAAVWKIYENDWQPNQLPTYGFKHGNKWFRREQRRDPVTQQVQWITTNECYPVAFSS